MKLFKSIMTIKTGIQEHIVSSLIVLFLALFVGAPSNAQVTMERFNLIADQIARPIKMEIRSFIHQADKKKLQCNLKFFSIKFIVNKGSFECDTVIFSNSVDKELKASISAFVKKGNIDWKSIINDTTHNGNGNYQLMLPVYFSRDKCTITKYNQVEVWNLLNDLLMIETNSLDEIIFLGSISMSMSTN